MTVEGPTGVRGGGHGAFIPKICSAEAVSHLPSSATSHLLHHSPSARFLRCCTTSKASQQQSSKDRHAPPRGKEAPARLREEASAGAWPWHHPGPPIGLPLRALSSAHLQRPGPTPAAPLHPQAPLPFLFPFPHSIPSTYLPSQTTPRLDSPRIDPSTTPKPIPPTRRRTAVSDKGRG